jgi:hypothetical protein
MTLYCDIGHMISIEYEEDLSGWLGGGTAELTDDDYL